jgi:hypothetical protein
VRALAFGDHPLRPPDHGLPWRTSTASIASGCSATTGALHQRRHRGRRGRARRVPSAYRAHRGRLPAGSPGGGVPHQPRPQSPTRHGSGTCLTRPPARPRCACPSGLRRRRTPTSPRRSSWRASSMTGCPPACTAGSATSSGSATTSSRASRLTRTPASSSSARHRARERRRGAGADAWPITADLRDAGPSPRELDKAKARLRWQLAEIADDPGAVAEYFGVEQLIGLARSPAARWATRLRR